MFSGNEMYLPSLAKGFPPPTGGKEELDKIQNGDVVGGRIGVSPKWPLRTPNQSPTKNISKTHKPQKIVKLQKPIKIVNNIKRHCNVYQYFQQMELE